MQAAVLLGYTESQLIQGCIAGNVKCQQALYALFSKKMFGVCMRYAKDYHAAEDILQDGFVKIFKNIDKYRGDGSFEGWVRRIFVNTSIEHYRKNSRMFATSELESVEGAPLQADGIKNLAANDLMKLVQQLSPGYRTVFNLYAIEGFQHKEIAKKLGISEGTSKSQLARARNILKKKVEALRASENV